jgi:hypothetical protein
MAQDKKPRASQPGRAPAAKPTPRPDAPHMVYCRCGTPMHPEHLETHRGQKVERYRCPNRKWWNGFWHPYAWMEPREGVPS